MIVGEDDVGPEAVDVGDDAIELVIGCASSATSQSQRSSSACIASSTAGSLSITATLAPVSP